MNKSILEKVNTELKVNNRCALGGLEIKGGDVIWVKYRDHIRRMRYKRITGVCLRTVKKNGGHLCVVRKVIGAVGVEFGFHSLALTVEQVRKVRSKSKRGGRAKLYNLSP